MGCERKNGSQAVLQEERREEGHCACGRTSAKTARSQGSACLPHFTACRTLLYICLNNNKMAPSRASTKRRRTSSGAAIDVTSAASPDKHTIFTQWAKDRGVQIGSVQPAQIPGRGVGLITTASIKKDEKLIFVPEKAMFKPAKTFSSGSTHASEKASPHIQLAASIMTECEKDSGSPYNTWKATWPNLRDFESSMPLFWNKNLIDLLPPSVKQPLERQLEDWRRDEKFFRTTKTLSTADPQSPLARKKKTLQYYWAIVNSRSFHFKPPGTKPGFMVLCPFLDYMNHGPSGTGVNVRQTAKGYEVTADRDYGMLRISTSHFIISVP